MELTRNDQTVQIKLAGRLDANTAPEVIECVQNETFEALELYLDDLEYISSAGLRALLVCKKTADSCQASFTVLNPQAAVMEIIALSGFEKVLDIKTK